MLSEYEFTIFCVDSLAILQPLPDSTLKRATTALAYGNDEDFNKYIQALVVEQIDDAQRAVYRQFSKICSELSPEDGNGRFDQNTTTAQPTEASPKTDFSKIYNFEWPLATLLLWGGKRVMKFTETTKRVVDIACRDAASLFLRASSDATFKTHYAPSKRTIYQLTQLEWAVDELLCKLTLGNRALPEVQVSRTRRMPVLDTLLNRYIDPITHTAYFPIFMFDARAKLAIDGEGLHAYKMLERLAEYRGGRSIAAPIITDALMVLPKHEVVSASLDSTSDGFSYGTFCATSMCDFGHAFIRTAQLQPRRLTRKRCKFTFHRIDATHILATNRFIGWLLWSTDGALFYSHVIGHKVELHNNKVLVDSVDIHNVS